MIKKILKSWKFDEKFDFIFLPFFYYSRIEFARTFNQKCSGYEEHLKITQFNSKIWTLFGQEIQCYEKVPEFDNLVGSSGLPHIEAMYEPMEPL